MQNSACSLYPMRGKPLVQFDYKEDGRSYVKTSHTVYSRDSSHTWYVMLGSSQFVLNQLGLIPLSHDPFCLFSTSHCFIGPLEFCPLVSSSCFISDSCYFVLDPFGPHPFRPWPNSPLISSSSWHFVFLFFVLCYFHLFPNCPLLLCPQCKSSFTA